MQSFIQYFRDHTNWQSQQQLFWFMAEISTMSAWDTIVTSTLQAKKAEKKYRSHCWQLGMLSGWPLSQVQSCCPQSTSPTTSVLQVKPLSQTARACNAVPALSAPVETLWVSINDVSSSILVGFCKNWDCFCRAELQKSDNTWVCQQSRDVGWGEDGQSEGHNPLAWLSCNRTSDHILSQACQYFNPINLALIKVNIDGVTEELG